MVLILGTPLATIERRSRVLTLTKIAGSAALLLVVFASPSRANLIVNGDFEAGLIGFTSDYTSNDVINDLGSFIDTTNPSFAHPSGTDYTDHTTGSGRMLMFNGDAGQGVAWRQTVAVTPGTTYDFSMWISSWFFQNLADTQLRINDVNVGPSFQATAPTGTWEQFTAQWDSEAATSAKIELVNLSTAVTGSDFAFDDISFVPEPSSLALLAFGGLFVMRRQCRR